MEYLKAWLFKEQALAKQGKKIHTEDEKTFLKYLEQMLTQVQSLMDTKLIRRTKTGNFELAEVAELQVQVRELKEKLEGVESDRSLLDDANIELNHRVIELEKELENVKIHNQES